MWKSEVGNNLYCCSLESSVLALLGHLPLRCSQHRIWAHTSQIVGDEKEEQQKKAYVGKTAQHDSSWWILPALSHCRNSSTEQTGIFYSWFKRMLTFCGYIPGTASSLPRNTDGGSCRAHLPSILYAPFSAVYHTPSTVRHHSLTISEKGSFPSAERAYGRGKGGTRPGNAFAHCSIPRQAGWARTIGTVARATTSRWHFLRKASRFPPPFHSMWIRQHLVPALGVTTMAQGRTEAPAGPSGTRRAPDRRACQLACGHLTRQ